MKINKINLDNKARNKEIRMKDKRLRELGNKKAISSADIFGERE